MGKKRNREVGADYWENCFFQGLARNEDELLDFIQYCMKDGSFLVHGVPDLTFVCGCSYEELCAMLRGFVRERKIRRDVAEVFRSNVSIKNGRRRRAIPLDQRVTIMRRTAGHCFYCGAKLTMAPGFDNTMHADHVFSAARGGSDDPANLMPACGPCNWSKKDKTLKAFVGGRLQ